MPTFMEIVNPPARSDAFGVHVERAYVPCIYEIDCPDHPEFIYVGQTAKWESRIRQYVTTAEGNGPGLFMPVGSFLVNAGIGRCRMRAVEFRNGDRWWDWEWLDDSERARIEQHHASGRFVLNVKHNPAAHKAKPHHSSGFADAFRSAQVAAGISIAIGWHQR